MTRTADMAGDLESLVGRSNQKDAPGSVNPIVEVAGLRIAFDGREARHEVVHGISFILEPNEVLAIVGESGSGKSVTARALAGLVGGDSTVSAETLRIGGLDARELSQKRWRRLRGREVGFVLQDALVSLDPLRTVGQEITEALRAHRRVTKQDARARVLETLSQVGIPDPEVRAQQRAGELSGGLRQRALIAAALAADPRVLVADEPTTALDVTVQAQILKVLRSIADAGRSVVLISHDLAVVAAIADRVIVMRNGEIVEQGATSRVLAHPTHEYTRALLRAVPSARTRGARLSATTEVYEADSPALADAMDGEEATARHGSGPLVEVTDVTVRFPLPGGGHRTAVDNVSLKLHRGETLGVVGESGSGKTTLGRVMLALQRPDTGSVQLAGEPWSDAVERTRRSRRNRIQVISQDPLGTFNPQFTVSKLIEQPLRLTGGAGRRARREEARRLLSLVGLGAEFLDRRPRTLSGGQRQRIAIAQALASRPQVLVCDEPVSALDVSTQAQVLDLLTDLQRQLGLSLLFISHDLGVVQHISQRVLVMKDGRVVEEGDVTEVLREPQHEYTRALLAAVPRVR